MYALAIHAGAGGKASSERALLWDEDYRAGLAAALALGQRILEDGGAALDAVETAVAALEDNPLFNAGRGAVLTQDGRAELDASIMEGGTRRAGAVAQVRRAKNPIRLARRVLEQSPHVFLVGEGADAYAAEAGLKLVENSYFVTPYRVQQLAAAKRRQAEGRGSGPSDEAISRDESPLGTVGAVARDRAGGLAAATSTGGTVAQRLGRVGDSPVIGAGTYADDESCAVSCTGQGEYFLRSVLAYDIAARLRYLGVSLASAVEGAIEGSLTRIGGRGGIIAVDRHGQIVTRYNTERMSQACVSSEAAMQISL